MMDSSSATGSASAAVIAGNGGLPRPAPWAPLALALLLSLAVHSALITSLQYFVAPLGVHGIVSEAAAPITARLVAAQERVTPDAARTAPPRKAETVPEQPQPDEDAVSIEPGMPLATYFFAKSEVDRPATAVSDVMLRYPRDAFRAGVHGTVILEVFIDSDGSVVRTRVVEAVPAGVFEEAAQQAISDLRYRPARKDDTAVRSRRLVQVVFDPDPPLIPPPGYFATGRPAGNSEDTGNGAVARQ